MKFTFIVFLFCFSVFPAFSQHSLKKLWTSDASLQVPESVLYDPKENCLWVSCIDGKPTEKDGKGQIAQLRTDGRIIDREWVSGLNAPKGMARFRNFLFVSDVTDLVQIDIAEKKIVKRIPVEGASFLNDVSAGEDGTIYVSDMGTGKVHQLKEDSVSVYLENLKGPNGILAAGNALFILTSGSLLKCQAGTLLEIAKGMDASTDGIEMVRPGEFVVSCWNGLVYFVTDQGKVTQMLDTRKANSQTADIGFDPSTNTVFVPTFFKNSVEAYQLK